METALKSSLDAKLYRVVFTALVAAILVMPTVVVAAKVLH